MSDQKFRLVTRSDFDGLVCAVLLKDLGIIDDINSYIQRTCPLDVRINIIDNA